MRIGILRMELVVYEALSLKDKRRVIKSIKDRVRARFNVSVAEVDHLDSRQRATLAIAMVSNEATFVAALERPGATCTAGLIASWRSCAAAEPCRSLILKKRCFDAHEWTVQRARTIRPTP